MRRLTCKILLLGFSFVAHAKQTLPVLEFYPACDYQVLDNVKAVVKVKPDKQGNATGQVVEQAFLKAKQKLLKSTPYQDDAGLIFTSKKLKKLTNTFIKKSTTGLEKSFSLTLQAELIGLCEPLANRERIPAPIASNGQKNGAVSKVGKGGSYTFSMKSIKQAKQAAKQILDYEFSFDKGVYGVKLGTSIQATIDVLGVPSMQFQLDKQSTILGFGRSTWFLFKNDALVKVTNHTKYINQDLINIIPFDQRFDDNNWFFVQASGQQISARTELKPSQSEQQLKHVVYSNEQATLTFHIEKLLQANSFETKYQISGFSYNLSHQQQDKKWQLRPNASVYTKINQEVSQRPQGLSVSDLPDPLGYLIGKNADSYLIYDNHLVMRASADLIDKVLMYDSVFNNDAVQHKALDYALLGITLEMPSKLALETVKGEVFEYGDIIEVTGDNYTFNLYLYEAEQQKRVYQAELLLY